MARNFVAASAQGFENSTGPIVSVPITLACFFRPSAVDGTNRDILMSYDAGTGYNAIIQHDTNKLSARTRNFSTGASSAIHGTTLSNGVDYHACAVFSANNSRSIYLNGTGKVTETTDRGTVNGSRFRISIPDNAYFSGDAWEAAIWSAALSDDEVLELAKGMSPLLVRPQSLEAYARLMGNESPEPELIQGLNLTAQNAPAKAAHGRMYYPAA